MVIENGFEAEDLGNSEGLPPEAETEPEARLLTALILEGVKEGVQKIEITPQKESAAISYHSSGSYEEIGAIPVNVYQALLRRVKLMMGHDLADSDAIQQGEISLNVGRLITVHVTIFPDIGGDRVILDFSRQAA